MADPVWVDGVTPVNSVNLTKLQTRDEKGLPNGYVGLDAGSNFFAPGDIHWGPSAAAPDVVLKRTAVGELTMIADAASSDSFNVNSLYPIGATGSTISLGLKGNYPWIYMRSPTASGGCGIQFVSKGDGGAGDWFIYTQLGTAPTAKPGMRFGIGADNSDQFGFMTTEFDLMQGQKINWWPPGGGAADTNLYRAWAGALQTDGMLVAAGGLAANPANEADAFAFVAYVGTEAKDRFDIDMNGLMRWGPGGATVPDTNLYRAAVGVLKSDGSLFLQPGSNGWGGAIYLVPSSQDYPINVYKLATDAQTVWQLDNTGKILWGPGGAIAPDTNMYRSAAGVLKTDGNLVIGGLGGTSQLVQVGAADSGGAGYRMLRVPN
jgi:hypothetical protein